MESYIGKFLIVVTIFVFIILLKYFDKKEKESEKLEKAEKWESKFTTEKKLLKC